MLPGRLPTRASNLRLTASTGSQLLRTSLTQHADAAYGSSQNKSAGAFGAFHHPSDPTLDSPQAEAQLSAYRSIG